MSKLESRFKQLVDDLALSIPFESCCSSQPQLQGPRSNFEVGGGGRGAPLGTQYWGGGHKTLFLTNSL